jgi:hypothetical protein
VEKSGNAAIIPELVNLLRRTNKKEVINKILEIFNNIKTQGSAKELAEAVRRIEQRDLLNHLVSACWKNGLDYSDYVDDFIQVFIHYDFQLALDAFTVIENSTRSLDASRIDQRINELEYHLKEMDENKQRLTGELVRVLNAKKENLNE